nr:hypothetical protein [Nostoc sp. CreGUA01]
LGTPSLELGTPSLELGTPSLELGTPASELGTPNLELATPDLFLGGLIENHPKYQPNPQSPVPNPQSLFCQQIYDYSDNRT